MEQYSLANYQVFRVIILLVFNKNTNKVTVVVILDPIHVKIPLIFFNKD